MTTITGAGENYKTGATGRAAPVTQRGPKTEKLLQAWKAASKAATAALAPAPRRRRRREEGRAAFTAAARNIISRTAAIPLYVPAAAYLLDTLGWLNLWQGNDATFSSDLDRDFVQPPSIAPHL